MHTYIAASYCLRQTFRDYSKLTLVIGVIMHYSRRNWDDAWYSSWYSMQYLYLFARLHLIDINILFATRREMRSKIIILEIDIINVPSILIYLIFACSRVNHSAAKYYQRIQMQWSEIKYSVSTESREQLNIPSTEM